MEYKTLFTNLLGGPGTGKSTTAAGVFCRLKQLGYNAELVQEYAKDKVWGEDFKALKFQPYIAGKQMYRQFRLLDQVDVAVTDSPIIFSAIYQGFGCVDGFEDVLVKQFHLFNNLNIYLKRNLQAHPYNPKGRYQNEEQAVMLDEDILNLLNKHNLSYHTIEICDEWSHIEKIVNLIQENL